MLPSIERTPRPCCSSGRTDMLGGLRKRRGVASDAPVVHTSKSDENEVTTPRGCFWYTAKMIGWFIVGLLAFALLATGGIYVFFRPEAELFLMRFFRDLARSKAHARLHGNEHALMAVLSGTEELLPVPEVSPDDTNILYFTTEDLASFNGEDDSPLYLAIMGRVYDVSEGRSFYAPGRSYNHYVGRDASRSFATGCIKPECLVSSLVGLSEGQKREAHRWLELYEHHDKYKFVGLLRDNPVNDAVERAILEDKALDAAREAERQLFEETGAEGALLSHDSMNTKAKRLYRDGRFDEALQYWNTALVLLGEVTMDTSRENILERADILVTMAALNQRNAEFTQAIENYQEALDSLSVAFGDSEARLLAIYCRGLSDMATARYMSGDTSGGITGLEVAVKAYGNAIVSESDTDLRVKLITEQANSRYNLGTLLIDVGRSADALHAFDAVLDALADLNDDSGSPIDFRAERLIKAAREQRSTISTAESTPP